MRSLRQRGLHAQAARANEKTSLSHSSVYDSEMEILSLDAANHPAVGDADLRVLRNTTATIVNQRPNTISNNSDSNLAGTYRLDAPSSTFSASYSETLSQDCLAPPPPPNSDQPQPGSSPSGSSESSNSSWSGIANEFGLNGHNLGMWRGEDLDWDSMVC